MIYSLRRQFKRKTISDVSLRCAISDPAYFHRVFENVLVAQLAIDVLICADEDTSAKASLLPVLLALI